jgi:hypothetical protein
MLAVGLLLLASMPHAVAVHQQAALQAINPYLFGFSSYIGPVVNLSFTDKAVLETARALRIGSLRYPGGSPSNSWNLTSGRWTGGSVGEYAARCDTQPIGTFTPENYMKGLGADESGWCCQITPNPARYFVGNPTSTNLWIQTAAVADSVE